jgi:hypothetical protein
LPRIAIDLSFTAARMAEKSCFKNLDAFILMIDAQNQTHGEKSKWRSEIDFYLVLMAPVIVN